LNRSLAAADYHDRQPCVVRSLDEGVLLSTPRRLDHDPLRWKRIEPVDEPIVLSASFFT
jgi:hypothetical protein